jgi:hypothetical protein
MHDALKIFLILISIMPLSGCLEIAALAVSALSNGAAGPAMKQAGPMAESVGQQTIQEALGLIDTGSLAICRARYEQPQEQASADSSPGATADGSGEAEPNGAACRLRPVCLPGFDQPIKMRVCERAEDAPPVAAPEVAYWSWERNRLADPAE